jgi:hypothetical protein
VVTLEDLTRRKREEVEQIKGVGPLTLERLDSALAEHGMSWAETT